MCQKINIGLIYMFRLIPINNHLIVFESEGDLSDNAYALYDYMRTNNYLKKYKAIWLVDDVERAKKHEFENTDFVEKNPVRLCIKRNKYLATCKWYIYDHCNVMSNIKKQKKRIIVYLCHGFAGYKASKGVDLSLPNQDNYLFVTGEIPAEILPLYRKVKNTEVEELGFPRIDYLYSYNQDISNIIEKHIHKSIYNKIYLWMPTFRECENQAISEEYQHEELHLPLINRNSLIEEFNDYLRRKNDMVILKIHHLQKQLSIFNKQYSNIIFISDEDIHEWNLQLYQFIPCTDALITDYSSISADYMLLDKPMVFILDDYEEYKKSRGIIPDNALELMTGDHVYTYEQLIKAMDRIHDGEDKYKIERRKMVPKFHSYQDGKASKRILDFLNVNFQ